MKIRAPSASNEPFECPAMVTDRHPRCCYGKNVLVLLSTDGGAVGPIEAEYAGYEVVEATEEERKKLVDSGYRLKGLRDAIMRSCP
jgi:hypothetical protein